MFYQIEWYATNKKSLDRYNMTFITEANHEDEAVAQVCASYDLSGMDRHDIHIAKLKQSCVCIGVTNISQEN